MDCLKTLIHDNAYYQVVSIYEHNGSGCPVPESGAHLLDRLYTHDPEP